MFKRLFNSDERSAQKLVVQLETSEDLGKIDILKTLAREKTSEALTEPRANSAQSTNLVLSSQFESRRGARCRTFGGAPDRAT